MIYRRKNESLMDYEERLYRNQSRYKLSWKKITEFLNLSQHPDITHKECIVFSYVLFIYAINSSNPYI